ncbi:osmoprotectant transport system permease protein [Microvirga flocculans]|uniref:Osmoprotectant transport system permease protein n=1 Tax=Microvirga flocculans TaxID=217168 RepID=A0A7W6N8H1_9HYPH|nr:ABC transporter permease [Microvirga flocculans]MBB4041248.1 osmoprotectant transport system permease protein [Microvirga flocculans]
MRAQAVLLRAAALLLLVAFVARPQLFAFAFEPLTANNASAIYDQGSLLALTLSHLRTVFLATLASSVLAVTLGVFVTRPFGQEFLPLSRSLVNIGQTFPPVAVLAIAVPLVGFGEKPTFIALFLYGLLPIFENTLTGLADVEPQTLEAAKGMGMNARQRLIQVELPLALPVILAGIRLSVIISLGTATIGSTVAAKGLGEVIIAGLQSNNVAFILQGGLVVALLAVLIHGGLAAVERAVARRLGRPAGAATSQPS